MSGGYISSFHWTSMYKTTSGKKCDLVGVVALGKAGLNNNKPVLALKLISQTLY